MASHSQQRTRRPPQAHQLNPGLAQNLQPRESSRSPSLRERPRVAKAQSAPLVPSVTQMYGQAGVTQHTQPSLQASPTISNASAAQRLHATPPQNGSPSEHRASPPLSQLLQNQNNMHPHYSHTLNRTQLPSSLTRYQTLDDDYQVTPELLAEIERADLQQSQSQGTPSPFGIYPRNDSTTPPKDLSLERIRAVERASPKELDQRWQRDSIPARESPQVRDRQPNSPSAPAFTQAQGATPERRMSPARVSPLGSSGETYTAYSTRDSPPVHRRSVNVATAESRPQYSLASQTPPLQVTQARTSDRSLPVQEEPEDDPGISVKNDAGLRDAWKGIDHLEKQLRASSPAPSSDLHPEGNTQRFDSSQVENRGRRDGEQRYQTDQEESEAEGANTPRSPSVGLPDQNSEKYIQSAPTGARGPVRVTRRNGSMDQLGLQGIDQTIYQPTPQVLTPSSTHSSAIQRPQQYIQHRKPYIDQTHHQTQAQYYADESSSYSRHYLGYPEDFATYVDPSLPQYHDDHYAERSRPDAPIPPTPHSQTAAPSPSPLITAAYARNGKNFAAPSPIAPVGSPYPYPFTHVRRNFIPPQTTRPPVIDPHDPAVIQEQLARQWQIYAQNNLGNMSDSTFSPSSTPFQGAYNPWANLHAKRTLGRAFDLRSMQSSPSHEPISLPPAPLFQKKANVSKLSHEATSRKPPPRVESTQPRDTSPEPSSSGEETAGEEQYSTANRNSWSNGVDRAHVEEEDGDGEWVDEDEEPDEDDLLELEYHPSYVNNVTKRRRRWEIGWEALLQAFQNLDRHTDATMVLLAAPSHSTKLYTVRSRSVKRQALQTNTPDMTPLRIGFKRIAAHRRKTRSHTKSSLVDRFLATSSSSGEGSDGSESREEELKRALEAAVSSLGAFRHIFEDREARWVEEMRRIGEDRERITNLLRQVLGERYPSDLIATLPLT